MNSKPHVVILTSATGGGHTSCANALRHAFHRQHGDEIRVTIADLWTDYAPWPLSLLPRWYYFFTNTLPFLWLALWKLMALPIVQRPFFAFIGRWVQPHLLAAYHELEPDVIVAVHPLVQRGVRASMQTLAATHPLRQVPWFTVVTDLVSAHPIWFDSTVEHCFVPTEEAAQVARANGISERKLKTVGLPSLPLPNSSASIQNGSMNHPTTKALSNSALPAILLIGGAEGMGPLSRIASAVERSLAGNELPQGQMVIICGTNERLRAKLSTRRWSIPVHVLGFVEDVQPWMQACHILVSKAGPSTLVEAFNNGLPILLSGYLPGQEAGSIAYVVQHGAGLYCPNSDEIGRTVQRWLVDDPSERIGFAARSRQLAQLGAADAITRQIMMV